MSTLTGRLITEYVNSGKLVIEPFDKDFVEPASYDLRLGPKILASPLGPATLGDTIELSETRPVYKIQTGQMVAVMSWERLELPLDLVSGNFGIRSHFARRGLIAFGGVQLDPGWRGNVTLNLQNVGPEPIAIRFQEPFFTVQFDRLEERVDRGYEGPHQDQYDFPQDQVEFILSARTTSLAEIPALRTEIARLRVLIVDLFDQFSEPDEDLELRPEIEQSLIRSLATPPEVMLSSEQAWKKMWAVIHSAPQLPSRCSCWGSPPRMRNA